MNDDYLASISTESRIPYFFPELQRYFGFPSSFWKSCRDNIVRKNISAQLLW